MKTLLVPTLAFTLASLSALAQENSIRKGSLPSAGAQADAKDAMSASPLLGSVHFDGASLKDVVESLNNLLRQQGADVLNIVISPELDKVTVPAISLRNVSATDVLKVITKISGLSLEPVPSDSGKAAAWIIGRRKPGSAANMGVGSKGGGAGSRGTATSEDPAGGIGANAAGVGAATETAQPGAGVPFIQDIPLLGNLFRKSGTKAVDGGVESGIWEDPAAGGAAQPQINRVLGIARIYADVADENERAEKEAMLVKTMREITEQQKLPCEVRLYPALHVIVVKGNPEAVELVEQTIAALKENLWGKRSDWNGSKASSGVRP